MKKRLLELGMALLLLGGIYFLSREGASLTGQYQNDRVVILDAGHGGEDPGKIGVHGEQEKEINLRIVKKIRKELKKNGIRTVLTRDSDKGLNDKGVTNKKVQDLQRRVEVIHKAAPVCAVSIHQNSYSEPEVKGAQVFYYTDSPEGKKLAEILQQSMIKTLDPENRRMAKGNTSYYLLKKTDVPLAIVECGFLSNPEEAELLRSDSYQQKIAEAVCDGILQYLKE